MKKKNTVTNVKIVEIMNSILFCSRYRLPNKIMKKKHTLIKKMEIILNHFAPDL